MEQSGLDHALLFLAISALEKVREESVEYKEEKRNMAFRKEVKRIQSGVDVMSSKEVDEEAVKRAAYISKCPTEPASGGLLHLTLGEETLRRRFDGDDVLRDVVNWLGGCASVIPNKLTSREWCLVDLNRWPIAPIDVESNMDRTLQFIGCWPSGKLEVRPSTEEWKTRTGDGLDCVGEKMGSSRGLGAAPSSALS